MNAEKILEVIAKGMTLIEALRQATDAASPAIKAMWELIEKHKTGAEITDDELLEVEIILDQQLEEFNKELPE